MALLVSGNRDSARVNAVAVLDLANPLTVLRIVGIA